MHDTATQLTKLATAMESCTECPALARQRLRVVPGGGHPHAHVMFVAAAPTAGEEASAAAAGSEQLATYLRLLDLDPRPGVSLYTTAAVKCLPRSAEGARAPTTGECDACWPFLSRELSTITPHVLVPAGATAAAVLLPRLLGTAAPELDPLHLQVVTTPAFRVVPIPSPEEIAALAPRPRKICLEQLRSLATRLGF